MAAPSFLIVRRAVTPSAPSRLNRQAALPALDVAPSLLESRSWVVLDFGDGLVR